VTCSIILLVGLAIYALLLWKPWKPAASLKNVCSLLKKAENGDASAQFEIGIKYGIGQDIAQDHNKSLYWCRKAAEQGFAEAQFFIGALYAGLTHQG